MTLGRKAELSLVLVTVIWGSTFILIKAALNDASPFLFVAVRFTIATAAIGLLFRRRFAWSTASVRGGCWAGLWLALGYFLQTTGLRLTTPSKSAFLTSLCTVLVPILAALVYRSVPRALEVAGAVVACAGIALMTGAYKDGSSVNLGDWLTIACAFAFAAQPLVLWRYASSGSFATLSLVQIATVAMLGFAICWTEPLMFRWSRTLAGALLFTAVLNTAVGFTVQAWAQQHTTPARVGLIYALEPVWAAVTSYVVAGEVLAGASLLGAGLVLGGVCLVELKPARATPHP